MISVSSLNLHYLPVPLPSINPFFTSSISMYVLVMQGVVNLVGVM